MKTNRGIMMQCFFPNSKTAVIQVTKNFEGSLAEVEQLVEKIGQYGNILSYTIHKHANKNEIVFKLAEDYKKFEKKD